MSCMTHHDPPAVSLGHRPSWEHFSYFKRTHTIQASQPSLGKKGASTYGGPSQR